MRKYYRFIPLLAILFIFNSLSIYAKLLNPLLYLQNKKTTKVHKTKKSTVHKKSGSSKLNIGLNFHKSKKAAKKNKPQELKVSILLPEEERQIAIPSKTITYNSEIKNGITKEIETWFGTKYKWGGKSERGIDCSGFTSTIYENALGIIIPRSSREQIKVGRDVDIDDLKFGDLVFFKSGRRNPGHVGIYIGDGVFAHSSSYKKRGVTYSRLDESSYMKRYVGARRILDEPRSVIGGE